MNAVQRLRATYEQRPVDHLVRREFGIWPEAIERWKAEGMPEDVPRGRLFGFDEESGQAAVHMLGWCEPAFVPAAKEEVLEVTDDYELVRDEALRVKKVFKGLRHGFMPTYLKHAVACEKDWEQDVAPLLSPQSPQRWEGFAETMAKVEAEDAKGKMISQRCIGAYMYLRALVGPTEILYMFVDDPGLVHRMMQAWLALADAVTARVQQHVELDEFFVGEDVCYNHGLLIGPEMMRRFILPYYQQLLDNIRSRQRAKRLHFHVDTDGNVDEAIDLYVAVGMDVMSPFEVAAGNDVVAVGRKYPELVMTGGIDKRVLAAGPEAIDEYVEGVVPAMVRRGGYIPTCDHGVPVNVSYANYMHYRKRMLEVDHL